VVMAISQSIIALHVCAIVWFFGLDDSVEKKNISARPSHTELSILARFVLQHFGPLSIFEQRRWPEGHQDWERQVTPGSRGVSFGFEELVTSCLQ